MEISFIDSRRLANPLYIDMRSPAEFREDHIPGALNIPLFDDQERAEIGTLYRQDMAAARQLGLRIIAPKLVGLMERLARMAKNKNLILYCWRGGLRSQAIYEVTKLMRIPCYRLLGGYKDYRAQVHAFFEQELPFQIALLHGLTGVGKTRLLHAAAKIGVQVLDLEGLANNRGSVFGNIGLGGQPSQKAFESALWAQLSSFDPNQAVVCECESRRIGRLIIPATLFAAMQRGSRILAYAPVSKRVQNILEDYQPQGREEELVEALSHLKARIGKEALHKLSLALQAGNFATVIEYLLVHYYDPLYAYPQEPSEQFCLSLDCADVEQAAQALAYHLAPVLP